ncbi:Anaphase-promoting complex subunit 23 [Geranomyces michiganensis]|nr:Anaphase-promoting complex subunit 23 [Geranomyces michiganensis]
MVSYRNNVNRQSKKLTNSPRAAEQLVTVIADSSLILSMDIESSSSAVNVHYDKPIEEEPKISLEEEDACSLALSYFHARQYKRAAWSLHTSYGPNGEPPEPRSGFGSPRALFLRLYATFLDGEETVATVNLGSDVMVQPHGRNPRLHEILSELKTRENDLDSYCLYLLGVVYMRLTVMAKARTALLQSLQKNPYNWSAWEALAKIPANAEEAAALLPELPDGHMQKWFHLHMMAQRKLLPENFTPAVASLENLFGNSLRLILLSAVCYFHQGKYRPALLNFELYRSRDPVSLEYADLHSHVLYVLSESAKLARLAHRCFKLDRYSAETQIVLGNFFSARRDHEQAVQAIQRALRLRPQQAQTLIMLGDEYLELKNANAALEAYRRAADAAPYEFRTWFGVAKSFDSLDMPEHAIPYLQKAAACDPTRGQIWTMMGQAFESAAKNDSETGKEEQALMSYKRALVCEDRSPLVLYYIAALCEKLGNRGFGAAEAERHNQAAFYYKVWIKEYDSGRVHQQNFVDQKESAISFLTQHYFRRSEYQKAEEYAVMIQHIERGKSLLRDIRNRLAEAGIQPRSTIFPPNVSNAPPLPVPPERGVPSDLRMPTTPSLGSTPASLSSLPPSVSGSRPTSAALQPPRFAYNTRSGNGGSSSASIGGGGAGSSTSQTLRALPGDRPPPGESWITPYSARRRPGGGAPAAGRGSQGLSRSASLSTLQSIDPDWDSPALDEDVR